MNITYNQKDLDNLAAEAVGLGRQAAIRAETLRLGKNSKEVAFVLRCLACLPGDDVATVVVEHHTDIEPTPAQYLDVGKVGLPKLIDRSRFVFELIRCLDYDERRAGDQIMRLQYAIHSGFRHKVALLIRERDGQLPRRQFRFWTCRGLMPLL